MTEIATILEDGIEEIIESEAFEAYLLRTDLAYFAEVVLNMEIADHHKEWSRLAHDYKKIGINAARDHGKSFFWCFAYILWRAYHKWIPDLGDSFKSIPRISIGYIFSNTQDQAIKHLELIKHEIETNEKLAHLLPEKKEVWSKQEIRLRNGVIIRARGWGVSVRGAHPSFIVCDDVLSEENLYSEVTRKKERDYLFSAVTPMLIPGGQLVVVGTPFHADDLYAELQKNRAYYFKSFPAIDPKGEKALWPTRYSRELLLERLAEVGSTRFAREYRCVPISDESSLFPERILTPCFDEQYSMPAYIKEEDKKDIRVFTGVDLALSSTVGADYTVITTLAEDKHGQLWIVDIRRHRGMSMSDQLREIQDVYRCYRPNLILIEDNGFQRVFRDELVRTTSLPIKGHTTMGTNKNSLANGVVSLQVLFENRKFIIPRFTERDRSITDELVNELKCFSFVDGKLQGLGTHDDMVMSLWIAKEASQQAVFDFGFVG